MAKYAALGLRMVLLIRIRTVLVEIQVTVRGSLW